MPGYDGTGPEGSGPSGWGMGSCGEGRPRGLGGFFGFRRGGRGGRRGLLFSRHTLSERDTLQSEKYRLESQLKAITSELEKMGEE